MTEQTPATTASPRRSLSDKLALAAGPGAMAAAAALAPGGADAAIARRRRPFRSVRRPAKVLITGTSMVIRRTILS